MRNELYGYIREFLNKSFKKVYIDRTKDYISIIALNDNSDGIMLCVWDREDYILGKIGNISKIIILDCNDLLMQPYGLFLFARNLHEFLEKLKEKIKVI